VPSQPVDVIKRSSRWAAQRWLLDAVIGLVGPEWDQGRVAYYAAACGQDSQVDFAAVRPRIRKYDVIGYSIFNDGSVRDFQMETPQWTVGKNFDRTGALGPFLVTADEVPAGGSGLRLTTRLNGQIVQQADTSEMIYDVASVQLFMKAGDVCEVAIEGIGLLRTRSSMNHCPVTPHFRYAI
jgi:hypothetical protein